MLDAPEAPTILEPVETFESIHPFWMGLGLLVLAFTAFALEPAPRPLSPSEKRLQAVGGAAATVLGFFGTGGKVAGFVVRAATEPAQPSPGCEGCGCILLVPAVVLIATGIATGIAALL